LHINSKKDIEDNKALPLAGQWIVITRPAHQSHKLQQSLQALGANVILFPLLEIIPGPNPQQIKRQLAAIQNYDLLIFVSPNAVEQALSFRSAEALNKVKIAAVGKKTALCLKQHKIAVDMVPEKYFNSEALLALNDLQANSVKGKKIALIRGDGGRKKLYETLLERGACVDNLTIYSRRCPQKDAKLLKQQWQREQLDIILLSSATSVANLFKLTANQDWFKHARLLLGSQRMQQQIPDTFQGEVLVADDPSDETLTQKLLTHG
jgi:uroporphyrinogen-III synthase